MNQLTNLKRDKLITKRLNSFESIGISESDNVLGLDDMSNSDEI